MVYRTNKEITEASNAKFLYCGIPTKGYCESMPSNASNYSKENYDLFLKELDKQHVPFIVFYSEILKKELGNLKYFLIPIINGGDIHLF